MEEIIIPAEELTKRIGCFIYGDPNHKRSEVIAEVFRKIEEGRKTATVFTTGWEDA